MNGTNRILNRALVLVVGLVLSSGGVAVLVAASWAPAAQTWEEWLSSATQWMVEADGRSRISPQTSLSWFVLGVLAVLALVVVLVAVVLVRLGGGRSASVLRVEPGTGAEGAVTIQPAFASEAITHSLTDRDEILSAKVHAWRVRGADVLQVEVTPRRNASPTDVAGTVTRLLDNLAMLTGRETAAYVSIRSGIRARLAADRSRVD